MKKEFRTINFDDIAFDFDNLFVDVNHLTDLEGEAIHTILKPYNVSTVLDCACGTGIQSIGLARKGYVVSASDISSRMVRRLKEKAKAEALEIEAKRADFRDLKPWNGRKFDAVISSGNSLTLLGTNKDVTKTLLSMYSCLNKPGIVIIGIHNYLKLRADGSNFLVRRLFTSRKNPSIVFDIRLFGNKRVQVTNFFISLSGNRWRLKTYTKSYMLMSADSLRAHLLRVGFQSIRMFDISGQRKFDDDEWVLAVGIK